ncbi:MAG: tetratricopeptide repeat protein, partial [Candidatus Solibacter usitatus]|nr:tetratricopeptide repeat protein [Candidatus Solibacter usitatus]
MKVILVCQFAGALLSLAQPSEIEAAKKLYQSTRYEEVVDRLRGNPDPEALQLAGQSWFQLGEFKKASETLEKALAKSPNSMLHLWLGRAYGRRAESSSPLTAPIHASKARDHFEKSVRLDPANLAAQNDLFDYYLR